jgi:thiamine biosynthesis lipoprotein
MSSSGKHNNTGGAPRRVAFLRHNHAAWLAASAVCASAVPASAETYLTEAQALGVILGENAMPRREERMLDDGMRAKLEHATNLKFPERAHTFFISAQPGQPQKYAIVMNEIGKTEPITFMVGMNDQGKVTDVVVMVFRENRGWEVKEKRFLNQFRGKSLRNSIRVDEDIINYTGATLSSKAIARGVKRALALLNAFYLGVANPTAASATGFTKALQLSPVLTVTTSEGRLKLFRLMQYAMGTVCEVRLWCDDAETAQRGFRIAFADINRLEQVFSAHRGDSELARVNREAGREAVAVSREFFALTRYAVRSWHESGGVSDITVGPLMELWGLRQSEPRQPSLEELRYARSLVGCDKLDLDAGSRALRFRRPGMELDFGGLAKGYAAQRVAGLLHSTGVRAALVNLGKSSLSVTSSRCADVEGRVAKETGVPFGHWLLGVTEPHPSQCCPIYVLVHPGESVSTSGTYERHVALGTTTLSHLIDPQTGVPLSGQRSATAIARSGPRSEVLAKQLLFGAPPGSSGEWILTQQNSDGGLDLDFRLQRDSIFETSYFPPQI